MSASSIAVSISVRSEDVLVVTLQRSDGTVLTIRTQLSADSLDDYRRELYDGLDDFQESIGTSQKVFSFQTVSAAMHRLHELGRRLNMQLFGTKRYVIERFLQDSCPAWRLGGSEAYLPPIWEIRSRMKHLIPFDIMPLFDTTQPQPIENHDQLARIASSFPGFSAIINRIVLLGEQNDFIAHDRFDNQAGLRVRLFQHSELPGAVERQEFFLNTAGIRFGGFWPQRPLSQREFELQLAEQIWSGSAAEFDSHAAHFQHFHCHCHTNRTNSADHSLSLASRKTDSLSLLHRHDVRAVTIRALDSALGAFDERPTGGVYPLVFLNACGSAKITPSGITSFVERFLSIGNRGVIGTEAAIPNAFASTFASKIYMKLLGGHALGEAIYLVRWEMLKADKNPLGILYMYYGNPEVRVEVPRPPA